MQPQTTAPPTQTPPPAPASPTPQMPQTPPIDPAAPAVTAAAPEKKAYGKRPKWQWVLIYVVVAAIVYGIVYYVFIRKTGTTGTTSGY